MKTLFCTKIKIRHILLLVLCAGCVGGWLYWVCNPNLFTKQIAQPTAGHITPEMAKQIAIAPNTVVMSDGGKSVYSFDSVQIPAGSQADQSFRTVIGFVGDPTEPPTKPLAVAANPGTMFIMGPDGKEIPTSAETFNDDVRKVLQQSLQGVLGQASAQGVDVVKVGAGIPLGGPRSQQMSDSMQSLEKELAACRQELAEVKALLKQVLEKK